MRIRWTAFHEAGQVVAAWRIEIPLETATIAPTKTMAGSPLSKNPLRGVILDYEDSDRARLLAEKAIIVALAGQAAQRRYNPRSWRSYHGDDDRKIAVDLALRLNGSSEATSAYIKWLEIRAHDIIKQRWRQVEAVANALLEKGTLSGEELRAVILASLTGPLIEAIRTAGGADVIPSPKSKSSGTGQRPT